MNFFRKIGVAVTTLVLSIATAVAIGQVRKPDYTQPESTAIQRVLKDYEDEEGFAELTEICNRYVVDNADVIDSYSTERIVNTIANMAVRDDGVVAVATETFAKGAVKTPEDLEKTAIRFYEKLGLDEASDAIMVIDTESSQYYMYDPSGKIFADMSDAELKSVEAALEKGFEEVSNGNAGGISTGVSDAYDAVARMISDPSSFIDLQSTYVQENDDGGFNIVEKTVDGGVSLVSGIMRTATGIVSGVFKIIGGSSIFLVVIIGAIILIVKSGKGKKSYDRSTTVSGEGGKTGKGSHPGQTGQSGGPGRGRGLLNAGQKGRNLSQSGNIDTSKISTQGSQYRWSANRNPYSGLNKGRADTSNNGFAGSKDMSGFVFPNDFGSSENGGQETNRPQN